MQKEIKKIAEDFRKIFAENKSAKGLCFVICARLHTYLNILGFDTELQEGFVITKNEVFPHFWLKVSDKKILDPTADQFNEKMDKKMPEVYMGKIPEWYFLNSTHKVSK